jgi:hypothetical protein
MVYIHFFAYLILLCFEMEFVSKERRITLNSKISNGGILGPYKKDWEGSFGLGDLSRAL